MADVPLLARAQALRRCCPGESSLAARGQPDPRLWKGVNYPASQKEIVEAARGNKADQNILETLHQLPDREYKNPAEISKEIGKI